MMIDHMMMALVVDVGVDGSGCGKRYYRGVFGCLGVWVVGVEKVARAEEGKVGGVC